MKRVFIHFLLPLTVTVIGGIIIYYVQQQSPEIKYTLSENIPLIGNISGMEKETNIQLLEIKNTGNKEAKNIQVILYGDVENVSVEKNSSADNFNTYKMNDKFELIYTNLPVSGVFKLVIQTEKDPIVDKSLTIQHSEGQAINALANKKLSFATILTWIIILIYILFTFKDLYIQSLYRKSYSYNQLDILHKVKPWFITKRHWDEIREMAMRTLLNNDIKNNVKDLIGYKLISVDKHTNINNEEWERIIEASEKQISSWIENYINDSLIKPQQIKVLLTIQRPKYFSEIKWDRLTNLIEGKLVEKLKKEISRSTFKELIEFDFLELKTLKIENKNYFMSHYLDLFEIKAEKMINGSEEPLEIYSKYCKDNNTIPLYLSNYLKSVAESKQLILTPNLYEKENAEKFIEDAKEADYGFRFRSLLSAAKSTIELNEKIEEYNYLKDSLWQIIYQNKKPLYNHELLIEEKFTSIMKLYEEINELKNNRKTVEKAKEELIPLKRKIEKQLKIIDTVINNPKEIEKIEDYSSEFAPGNFRNLKRLAIKISSENN